jgi:hypothetical protein
MDDNRTGAMKSDNRTDIAWRTRGQGPKSPLDPLQRRAELIDHYDRHGYPERAEYLRRIDEGQAVLTALNAAFSGPNVLGGPAALRAALTWWANAATSDILISRFTDQLLASQAPATPSGARRLSASQRDLHQAFDDTLVIGLAARVNARLQPWPIELNGISPDMAIYQLLTTARRAFGSLEALPKWTLPPPHWEMAEAHLVVCELCTIVDLHREPSRRCRLCKKRHAKPNTLLVPKRHVDLPWLITGYAQKYLHHCDWCGQPLFGNADAKRHPACKTAASRHAAAGSDHRPD